jgi:replicative DNA helicase
MIRGEFMGLICKRSVFQVLGNLMKKPSLLDDEKYKLTKDDFYSEGESSFYVIIFAAINNLYEQGIEEIDIMMIDSFLSSYEVQYKVFNDNNGLEYLENASEQSNIRNFDYSYNRLKKFSLLREYKKNGFDIKDIYDESVINPKEQELMMEKFDNMTLQDIVNHFEEKQLKIRSVFLIDEQSECQHAAKGARQLLKKFKEEPDYGVSLIGNLQNTIFRGAKPKTLFMRSAPSNLGKTRLSLAEATDLAIDEIYDLEKKKWIYRNKGENVLFISTEMEAERLQPTILSYISGVKESKIKDGDLTPEEEQRLEKAVEVLEKSNFWIEYIPDFDTQMIETKIKQHIIENQAQYIFFDYVHISYRILQELAEQSRGMKLREDMVLFMFIFRLEQIAKRYGVYISTASQVNGDWKNIKDADSTILRGSKAMADKLHRAVVALKPTKADLEALEPILRHGFYPNEPNLVYHIYKNRETKYKDVKLWLYVDMDTMRIKELFLTNNDYELIDIQPTEIKTKQFDF